MIRGRFIGVDRFRDPVIRDLSGCARDATALHAIFKDGLPPIDAELITNEVATVARIRQVLEETLGSASPDDAVVLTISSHGTHDYRIVANDTTLADLDASTLTLDEFVAAFRSTQAKFAFVILDCCFAGAAPARVVSETPEPRTIVDLASVQGAGKVILSASRMDEAAYEHPSKRHGLLTAALVEALTTNSDGLLATLESVIARVRADAASMGVAQNPVMTTYVDGGFSLPLLCRGDTFLAAFPEFTGATTGDIDGIANFGIPPDIVAAWSGDFDNKLHKLQLDAINDYRVLDGRSLIVVAPTSSGKTFVAELAAIRAILDGRKAVFLLPYKALVSEKYENFQYKYGERLGLRVIRCNSDYRDHTSEFIAGKFDIAVLTYEMFLGLSVANRATLNLLGLVVIDEAQFITDRERGITVELILTLLRMNRARGVAPQLVILSAVLGNVRPFSEWLDIPALESTVRPVPLDFGVLDRRGVFQYRDSAGAENAMQLLPAFAIRQRQDKPSSQDVIVPLVSQIVKSDSERVLVFRNRRGQAEGSARYLARELGLARAGDAIAALPTTDLSTSSPVLREALEGGTAFHDTNLNAAERAVVERLYRNHQGGIRVLTSTSGLAAGINTPASTVIIAETTYAQPGNPAMSVADVRNMAGRAGRYGYQETGRAIILADNAVERQRLFRLYVLSEPNSIRSSFDQRDVPTWLIRLLRQVGRIPRDQVPSLLVGTFGGYIATTLNPALADVLKDSASQLLDRMLSNGLLDETGDGVSLTLLGNACGASSLTFESCLRLIESLRQLGATQLSPQTLLTLIQTLPEGDDMYVPLQRRGTAEGRFASMFASRFGAGLLSLLQRYASDQFIYWGRLKRCLLALAWASGAPIEAIEKNFSVNPFNRVGAGDIRGVATSTRYVLRSVFEIAVIAAPAQAPDPTAVDHLIWELEFGLPYNASFLIDKGLTRDEAMAALQVGIGSADVLEGLSRDYLAGRLDGRIVDKLLPAEPS